MAISPISDHAMPSQSVGQIDKAVSSDMVSGFGEFKTLSGEVAELLDQDVCVWTWKEMKPKAFSSRTVFSARQVSCCGRDFVIVMEINT